MVKAIIRLFKAAGAGAGATVMGAWTRIPYTDVYKDSNGIVLQLFANGSFRLKRGIYSIRAMQSFYAVGFANIRVKVNGVVQNVGNVSLATNTGDYAQDAGSISEIIDQIEITNDSHIVEIEYYAQNALANGLGVGDSVNDSVFGYVEIQAIGSAV